MPELPDLEVFKGNVMARLTSKRLAGVEVYNPKKVYGAKAAMIKDLQGRELRAIDRIGKELFFNFGGRCVLAVHLMLNGQISIVEDEASLDAVRYKILAMRFERQAVVFSDRGGLCTVKYRPVVTGTPDALDPAFTLKYLQDRAREQPHANIKALLIDQQIVKGIGNAYADEILWAARISPHSLVGRIPQDRLAALHEAIGAVLGDAIRSIRRIAPDIISGEERSFLKVHNRSLSQTETGYPIIVERIAAKTTYYTAEQVRYG